MDPVTGKIIGYKTPGGADTVFPFSNAIYLGAFAPGSSVNVALHYSDYANLTVNDFVIGCDKARAVTGSVPAKANMSLSAAVGKSYNATTGLLKVNAFSAVNDYSLGVGAPSDAKIHVTLIVP